MDDDNATETCPAPSILKEPKAPGSATESLDEPSLKIQSPLYGHRIAFVGKLGGMNRREARMLVRKNGAVMSDKIDPMVDLIVIGADQLPTQDQESQLLDEWAIKAASEGRLRIISETQFWQDLGLVEPDLDVCRLYTPAMLAKLLDIPVNTIRRWHRRGLIEPTKMVHKLPYFDFQEVASARRIARLIASGETPSAIESKLSQLAGLYPDLQRPLSQLSVIVEGRNILLRDGEGLIEPGGQKLFDFDAVENDDEEASVIQPFEPELSVYELKPSSFDNLETPEQFLQLANELEDSNRLESATEVYRAMGLAFGPRPDIAFRLAELLYLQGDLAAARERYYAAVEMDSTYVEARASLGCVLVELGQSELAISAFKGTLDHHPDYPDVHYHLASLLDDLDREEEALVYWKNFLELAPKSPWAEQARLRVENQNL